MGSSSESDSRSPACGSIGWSAYVPGVPGVKEFAQIALAHLLGGPGDLLVHELAVERPAEVPEHPDGGGLGRPMRQVGQGERRGRVVGVTVVRVDQLR